MKKTFLVLLIALMAIGFVFADYGKINVGGKIGYLPQLKMAQLDAAGRWQLDVTPSPEFTTDIIVETGLVTNFKDQFVFDGYVGAGLTFKIADKWSLIANCGLDMMLQKDSCELGVAANAGCEYAILDNLAVNANFKVTEFVKTRTVLYKPGLGVSYSF